MLGDIHFTNEMDWKDKYEEAIEEQKCQMELFLSEEEGMKLEARKYKVGCNTQDCACTSLKNIVGMHSIMARSVECIITVLL